MKSRSKKYEGKCYTSNSTFTDSIENQSLPTLPIKNRTKWGLRVNALREHRRPDVPTTKAKDEGKPSRETEGKYSEQTKLDNVQHHVYLAGRGPKSFYHDGQASGYLNYISIYLFRT